MRWCWKSLVSENNLTISTCWSELNYNGDVKLEKVYLKNDDLKEIVDLYQEIWDNSAYKDSLLIAENFAQWLWANAFAQNNINTLKNNWLTLSDIERTQIKLAKNWKIIYSVMMEYEITEWLITGVPLLYVSQLFIPCEKNIVLLSFITEDLTSHLQASKMLKSIK